MKHDYYYQLQSEVIKADDGEVICKWRVRSHELEGSDVYICDLGTIVRRKEWCAVPDGAQPIVEQRYLLSFVIHEGKDVLSFTDIRAINFFMSSISCVPNSRTNIEADKYLTHEYKP